MRLTRRGIWVLAVGIGLAAVAAPATAQNWPQRGVKFILPLGPGSGADIAARMIGDRLTQRWGQPVVIENRPGADGIIAITTFISARDDHTFLFGPSSSYVAHPYLHDKMPYDPRALVPVARVSTTLVGLAVPAAMGVASVADLIARVRAEPGKLNWATATGMSDLIVAGYLKSAGLDMAKVPYRDTVQAINDLGEQRIHMYIAALAIVRPHVLAGRARLLAVTNREKAPDQPELPTVEQAGFPELNFDGLIGLWGPREMADDLRNRIAADIASVVADPVIVARLTATGQLVRPGGPAEFAAAIEAQRAQLARFADTLGIKPKQ